MRRSADALAALQDADALLCAARRRTDFSLLKYLPAPILAVSALVAGPERSSSPDLIPSQELAYRAPSMQV